MFGKRISLSSSDAFGTMFIRVLQSTLQIRCMERKKRFKRQAKVPLGSLNRLGTLQEQMSSNTKGQMSTRRFLLLCFVVFLCVYYVCR